MYFATVRGSLCGATTPAVAVASATYPFRTLFNAQARLSKTARPRPQRRVHIAFIENLLKAINDPVLAHSRTSIQANAKVALLFTYIYTTTLHTFDQSYSVNFLIPLNRQLCTISVFNILVCFKFGRQ